MTISIFEEELRSECRRLYVNLKNGTRERNLQKKKVNSLTDVVFIGRHNSKKLFHSAIITFGHVLENTASNYAARMDVKVFRKKTLLASNIDVLFQIDDVIHHLESKANIELDNEKSKKALDALQRKHKIVFNALACHDNKWRVLSKFVVWTKEDSIEAASTAKRPITRDYLMGFKDFFNLFEVEVEKDEFFEMIQKVWMEEVELYIYD